MSIETEIVEVKEEKVASPDNAPVENQYKIFGYFKDNTGMLIACVSALVAIGSWLLRFAVGRMNYAYLAYWDIAALHANIDNQNEFYMIAGILAFTLVLMIIRSFLSNVSDTFRFYMQLLSLTNRSIKLSKRNNQKLLKKLQKLLIAFAFLPSQKKQSDKGKELKSQLDKLYKAAKEEQRDIRNVRKARQKLRLFSIFQIAFAVLLLYLLGSMFIFLVNMTGTMRESFRISWTVALFIAVELFSKYVPAYIQSRCACKKYGDDEVDDRIRELLNSKMPNFPFENLKTWKIKTMLTDRVLKSVMIFTLMGMMCIVFSVSFIGTLSAGQVRSFPMYSDGATSYAIVYTSGSTRYMEEAVVKNGVLTIDTTKQRIITSDDIFYTVEVFDDVSVIRRDETLIFEKDVISIKKVSKTIGSFIETIYTKAGEVWARNAKRIPGT